MDETTSTAQSPKKLSWRFPRTFWIANTAELLERAAFYGMFIALTLYLTRKVGFTDVEVGYVGACFASILYLLPLFVGAMADRIGFRKALMLAFVLLTVGYALLGAFQYKRTAILSLAVIMVGGAIVKPVIAGTVGKCSDDDHRARAFSIFYMMVNIGAFFGKTVAKPLRTGLTLPYVGKLSLGLEYVNFYAASMAFLALLFVAVFYRDVMLEGSSRSVREVLAGLGKVFLHFRFLTLIIIVAGFWAIQTQLYSTMPKYMLRLVGEHASPEWLANINPFVVILCVVPITHLVRRTKPENSIAIGLLLIAFTPMLFASSAWLQTVTGNSIGLLGTVAIHPLTLMAILGIGLQGLSECFLSPKFLEYASKQAPQGEEGLYMGYQNLTTCLAYFMGFVISGYSLDRFCPDPNSLRSEVHRQWQAAIETGSAMPQAYAHAHYIWYVFAGIGFAAFFCLLIFKYVTNWIDARRAAAASWA
jgi:dipeptide/tripeptide permease